MAAAFFADAEPDRLPPPDSADSEGLDQLKGIPFEQLLGVPEWICTRRVHYYEPLVPA